MSNDTYRAIYDFALMPYALGDALTWNVHSTIRCEEAGRKLVDVFLCLDEQSPSNVYQRDFATSDNSALLFNELFGAFNTHPRLGNVFFYRQRAAMTSRLRQLAGDDAALADTLNDYEATVAADEHSEALKRYFTKNAHSHEAINAFYRKQGRIPLLGPSLGCEPDVAGLMERRFAGKRVVTIHMRMRRLDIGYGGEHSYARDSDFGEWFEFLREAARRYPDVQFVAMGRRQEKPLEMLQLPNVSCLRVWGLGLGHELTFLRRSDLFIGASSGFAAMAYFSDVPYFITRMTEGACKAYDLEFGAKQFPFGSERQALIYEPETRDLLMRLLEQGLVGTSASGGRGTSPDPAIDVRSWEWERSQWLYPGATSYRFFDDPVFADKETAFLLWRKIKEAQAAAKQDHPEDAWATLERISRYFPRLSERFPEYLRLRRDLALRLDRRQIADDCQQCLDALSKADSTAARASRYVHRLYPALGWLKWAWSRKHRLPGKLIRFFKTRFATP